MSQPLNDLTLKCQCGDSDCVDTFGRATAGQDRSDCCQYCGYYDCDVCGWTDPARVTPHTEEVPW